MLQARDPEERAQKVAQKRTTLSPGLGDCTVGWELSAPPQSWCRTLPSSSLRSGVSSRTLGSPEKFEKEASVVSPQHFCKNRSQLTISFSDQVPLWAKAPGREAVFAEHETLGSEDTEDYSEIRRAIAWQHRQSGQQLSEKSFQPHPDSAKQQPRPEAEEQQQLTTAEPKPEPKAK